MFKFMHFVLLVGVQFVGVKTIFPFPKLKTRNFRSLNLTKFGHIWHPFASESENSTIFKKMLNFSDFFDFSSGNV